MICIEIKIWNKFKNKNHCPYIKKNKLCIDKQYFYYWKLMVNLQFLFKF